MERVSGSGRPRTAHTVDNVAKFEDLLTSGDNIYALAFALEADIWCQDPSGPIRGTAVF